jgi:predicted acylesterase/phospholipase RssA
MKRLEEFDSVRIHESMSGRETDGHLSFECVALLLQGGGALGAYQSGVYEALAEANIPCPYRKPNRLVS